MTDLKSRFDAAVEGVEELPSRPDNATLLKLYSLYKQATVGDVVGDRPGPFDLKGRAKYDAWAGLQGRSAEEAMEAYVALVEELGG